MGGRRTASSSTWVTASGSTSSARAGFEVERLVELFAPDDAETHAYYDTATADWARKWPSEDLWVARKTG